MPPFDQKVVIITGAAGGLGRALSLELGRQGARLALFDRDEAGLKSLTRQLQSQGVEAVATAGDVTHYQDCQRLLEQVRSTWDQVDILINNAGITHRSRFETTEVEVLRRVMEVNYFGAVHCTRAALPDLIKSRGKIAVLSSVAGIGPLLGRSGYCASKYALHGFFETLRQEL